MKVAFQGLKTRKSLPTDRLMELNTHLNIALDVFQQDMVACSAVANVGVDG